MRWPIAMVALLACGHRSSAIEDAPPPPPVDAAVDAAIDAAVDAPPDALPDAAPDAPPSTAPACRTAPTILVDVSPRRLSNIARADHLLYLSAFALDGSGQVTSSSVETIDLATGQPSGAPLAITGAAGVYAAGGDVYAPEFRAAGTIWQLHPGSAPVAVITGRPFVRAVTADAGYLYWSEEDAVGTDVVRRRLITDGPIEPVMTCNDARRLVVVGDNLYCASFSGNLLRAPKTGGTATGIPYVNNYPIVSMIDDGGVLFFVNLFNNPELYRVPLPDGPAKLLKRLPTLGRYVGLTASPEFFYTVDENAGIRRIARVGLAVELIYDAPNADQDPVLWNDQLYFVASTPTSSGDPLVLHCVD
jgi:hypothetical protein